jgi:hypothetical protein
VDGLCRPSLRGVNSGVVAPPYGIGKCRLRRASTPITEGRLSALVFLRGSGLFCGVRYYLNALALSI